MNTELLTSLAEEFGTPLYVYDGEIIERQYKRLMKAFDQVENRSLHYAVKALNNISVLKFMKKLGASLDTVSLQEINLGLRAGFSPDQIMFTPSGVSMQELVMAKELGVHINIDNLSLLEQFGALYPQTPVCVRINPHIMAGGNKKISVGHIDSKFGISIHQVPHIKRVVENTGMRINGVHMHTGSDILDIEVFLSAADLLFDVAKSFDQLEFIDFGSGFKVPYKEGDYETNIEQLGQELGQKFNDFCAAYGKDLELVFEPGKFLVSESGKFLTEVNVIKQTTSTVFAQVDTGFNHLGRPMMYDAYHHIHNISNPNGKDRYYTVTGYICETDTFGTNRKIAEIREGDLLCMDNAGAYCFTMASQYNSRYRPAEVFVYKGNAQLIRARESFEDLLKNQIEIEF
jgi:diaminopimelate decarboxylase